MLKQGVKTINAEFIRNFHFIITTFFRPVQTLCNLVSGVFSHFDINVKK